MYAKLRSMHSSCLAVFITLVVVSVGYIIFAGSLAALTRKSSHQWTTSLKLTTNSKVDLKAIKLLCWVTTSPSNYEKALAVRNTWCSRCDKCIFTSSASDASLPAIELNVSEGRNYLWSKTKAALQHVYYNDYANYDWFLKADDDTYVIVENLKSFLYQQNLTEPTYFGAKFKLFVRQGYMSGGAGYVMPKEALKKFVTEGLQSKDPCSPGHDGDEDVQVGLCMEKIGVKAGDSRDALNRHRFLPEPPDFFFRHQKTSWLDSYSFYPFEMGRNCCSDSVISFHRISPPMMEVLEYLIYGTSDFLKIRDY